MSARKGTVLPRFIQDVETDLSGAKVPRFSLGVVKRGQAAPPTTADFVVITIPYKNMGVPVFSHSPAAGFTRDR